MSFIYEALKRAEDENARGVVTPRTVRRPAFFAARPRWWLWALIGVLGANAALLVTLVLVRGSRSPDATMATTTSTEPAPEPVVAPPSAVPSAKTVAPAPPVARAVPPASPSVARPALPAAAPATPVTPPLPRVEPPPAPTPSTAARDSADVRPASPRPATPVAPGGAVVAPPASTPAAEGTAPAAGDAPKLQIQVVVYDDVPAQRMVFIDGRRYAEGDKVDADTVIERITPEGAIVTRRGQRFTLTSGRP